MEDTNKDLESKRTRCSIYCRVMGYFSPVVQYNLGKKSEFYSRKVFSHEKTFNSKFIDQYWENDIKHLISVDKKTEVWSV